MWFAVRSIVVWLWMLLLAAAFLPLTAILSLTIPFDRRRRALLWESHMWCRLAAWAYPNWKWRITGLENVERGRHYVVMSNHASFADIVLLAFLPLPYRWVSKREIFFVPIFGWQMWVFGHLSVRRRDRRSVERFLRAARRTLESGLSILIFPEGTRSKTGRIGPFKPGGFQLASDTGTPILPVLVAGTHDTLPKHSWVLRNRTFARLHVLPALPVARGEDPDALAARVRAAMIEHHDRVRDESAALLAAWLDKKGLRNPNPPPPAPPAPR